MLDLWRRHIAWRFMSAPAEHPASQRWETGHDQRWQAMHQVPEACRGCAVQALRCMSGLVHQGREEAGAEAEAERPLPEVR